MIDLRKLNEHDYENTMRRIKQGKYTKGTRIVYHEGNFSDEVGVTRIGRDARKMFDAGLVHLFQKKLQQEPVIHQYLMEVK